MSAEYTREQVLLSIKDVSLAFGNTVVLDHVSAEIRNVVRPGLSQGQVVGFLGPSGRGKTQLFRILAGLQQPTSGTAEIEYWDGKPYMAPVRAGKVGVVDQHYTLFAHRTVGENLLPAGYGGWVDDRDHAMKLPTRFGLESKWGEYPSKLSGGQRQRVAICQQLMRKQKYLLMDEPFSGLDPIMKDEACKLIREIAAAVELLTIIVITHDIASSVRISDTLWLLGHGHEGPGSRIQKEIDLIALGLAWDENMHTRSAYSEVLHQIHDDFRTL